MEQRYLCFALFNQRGGMLARSLEGVDREALYAAVRSGLRNEDGRARGSIGSVYRVLSYEEVKPLLPAIHEAIVKPAPSGIMFSSGIRLKGLELLAKHRIKEGIPLCIPLMDIHSWGKKARIASCLKTLEMYGPEVKKPGTFAANCLLARRLAERDVRFTQVFIRQWDQHILIGQ